MTSSEPDQYTGLELLEISGWSKTDDGYSIEWEGVEKNNQFNQFIYSQLIHSQLNQFIHHFHIKSC